MTSRRQVLLPLALAPVAGWAIWAAGSQEPPHPVGPFHLPLDASTALWRDLVQVRVAAGNGGAGRVFPARVSALEGRKVTVRGFLVPLSDAAAHTDFILAANPAGCPACPAPTPATMLHVHSPVPVPDTRDPVVLSGTLRVSPQEGLFYRLDRAALREA